MKNWIYSLMHPSFIVVLKSLNSAVESEEMHS